MEQGGRSLWAQTRRRTPQPPQARRMEMEEGRPCPRLPRFRTGMGREFLKAGPLFFSFLNQKPLNEPSHTISDVVQIYSRVWFFLKYRYHIVKSPLSTCINCFNGFWKNSHLLSLLIKAPEEPSREGCWGTRTERQLIWEPHCHTLLSEPRTCPTFLREVGTHNSTRSPGFIITVKQKKMQMPKPKWGQLHFERNSVYVRILTTFSK